jgi:hypothetical protein
MFAGIFLFTVPFKQKKPLKFWAAFNYLNENYFNSHSLLNVAVFFTDGVTE